MRTLFTMAVAALALVGCGPLEEGESMTGKVAQALEKPSKEVVISIAPDDKNAPRSAQEALYVPERPTFENTFIYDTGIKP